MRRAGTSGFRDAGFGLVDLLVGMFVSSLVVLSALASLSMQDRAYVQQELRISMEDNLRMAHSRLLDTMRVAGFGVPGTNLTTWIPWVSGFNAKMKIGGTPATVSAAHCTLSPVVQLSANTAVGATTLSVASQVPGKTVEELLNAGSMRLISVNQQVSAHVKSAGSGSITIDTDPTVSGNQGLSRGYPAGTPICRVDVMTFQIAQDDDGRSHLYLDGNQGAGPEIFAEGITDLGVTTIEADKRYRVSMTAQARTKDPISGSVLSRSLAAEITRRNES